MTTDLMIVHILLSSADLSDIAMYSHRYSGKLGRTLISMADSRRHSWSLLNTEVIVYKNIISVDLQRRAERTLFHRLSMAAFAEDTFQMYRQNLYTGIEFPASAAMKAVMYPAEFIEIVQQFMHSFCSNDDENLFNSKLLQMQENMSEQLIIHIP